MVQELLVGPERRRRWSDEQKMSIVVEAASGDATVSDVARRHGISRQQRYQWRSDIRRGRLVDPAGGPFLAMEFVGAAMDDADADTQTFGDSQIEIMVCKGRCLRVPASIAPGVLSSLVRAMEEAAYRGCTGQPGDGCEGIPCLGGHRGDRRSVGGGAPQETPGPERSASARSIIISLK